MSDELDGLEPDNEEQNDSDGGVDTEPGGGPDVEEPEGPGESGDTDPVEPPPSPAPEPEALAPPMPSMRDKMQRDLAFAQRRIKQLDAQYERSLLISGGQVSDKSRIEMPSIMHIDNNLRYWKGEETRLMSLLDPECASRAHVPLGFLR